MSEMVKIVEQALSETVESFGQGLISNSDAIEALSRAAIKAMREPTEAMMVAGGDAEDAIELEKPTAFRARIVWRAMNDAALETPG